MDWKNCAQDELIHIVQTKKVTVVQRDWGDMWNVDYYDYNTPERLAAADELATRKATEALPALQDLFVACVKGLDTYRDKQWGDLHTSLCYPNELRRLVESLLLIGGTEAFDALMMEKVFNIAIAPNADSGFNRKDWPKILLILERDFKDIGSWYQKSYKTLEEQTRYVPYKPKPADAKVSSIECPRCGKYTDRNVSPIWEPPLEPKDQTVCRLCTFVFKSDWKNDLEEVERLLNEAIQWESHRNDSWIPPWRKRLLQYTPQMIDRLRARRNRLLLPLLPKLLWKLLLGVAGFAIVLSAVGFLLLIAYVFFVVLFS